MNFIAIKIWGKIVGEISNHISSSKDIYKAIATLPYNILDYYYVSLMTFLEIKSFKDTNSAVIKHLVNKNILKDSITSVFPWKPTFDEQQQIEYIDKELGDGYSLLSRITVDIISIDAFVNPEKYDKSTISVAHEEFKIRLEDNEINRINWNIVFDYVLKKKNAIKQTEKKVYHVKDEKQCLAVFNFLIEEDVIEEDTPLYLFLEALSYANMSIIRYKVSEKFAIAVARMKWLIKTDAAEWQKTACMSINTSASKAQSNTTNNQAWFERLCKIIPNSRSKRQKQ